MLKLFQILNFIILNIFLFSSCYWSTDYKIKNIEYALGTQIKYPINDAYYYLIRQDQSYVNPFIILARLDMDSSDYIKLIKSIGLIKFGDEMADSLLGLNGRNRFFKPWFWNWGGFNASFPKMQSEVDQIGWWKKNANKNCLFAAFYDDSNSPKISYGTSETPKGKIISTYNKGSGFIMIETDLGSSVKGPK